MRLNVSVLSDPNSLCIPFVSPLVCAPDYLQPIPIQMLVDSGSTHCFLNSAFAHGYSLPTTPTPPVELRLFDRTSNNIVTNFIWPYLYQFFDDSHSLNGYEKPLERPFN